MPAASFQETGEQPAAAAPVLPAQPAAAAPATSAPQSTDQDAAFSADQVKAWAEGKQPAAPAPPQEEPFTADQVKAWAERGTGLFETSPVLSGPPWWMHLLEFVFPQLGGPFQNNFERLENEAAVKTAFQMVAGVPGAIAGVGTLLGPEALQGKSIAEAQAYRDYLIHQRADLDSQFDQASKGGALDGELAGSLAQGSAILQHQIDAADAYIAAGGKPAPDPLTGALRAFSSTITGAGQKVAQAMGEVPVQTQESPGGQVASVAGGLVPQVAAGLLGEGVTIPAFLAQTYNAQSEQALAKGASDRTAAIAGFTGMLAVPAQLVAPTVAAGALSKLLAGETVKAGLVDIGKALLAGGAGQGSYQFMQNVAARVSGYDG